MRANRPAGHTGLNLRTMISCLLLLLACSTSANRLELIPVAAKDILTQAASHGGSEAVLINFWGTWCEPCVAEFPLIVELASTYHADGLAVYFVSVDWLTETTRVEQFLNRQGVKGISFIKDQKDEPFIAGINPQWSGALPFTAMYGRSNGELTDYWEGAAPRERFVAAIEAALQN